jgi:Bacterial mobilisation protein (MobC)
MTAGGEKSRARRPVSYDTEPCEGRQASPSNPSPPHRDGTPGGNPDALGASVIFRCTPAEKTLLAGRAHDAGVSLSGLMREALGLVDARRRRPMPKADPALLRELGRIGGNLNQVARWLNTASATGSHPDIDALVVATKLVAIERALTMLANPPRQDQSSC